MFYCVINDINFDKINFKSVCIAISFFLKKKMISTLKKNQF